VLAALLAASLAAGLVWPAELSGQVKALTGEPLPARVLIVQPDTRASVVLYTDPAGNFKSEVPDGVLHVLATHGPEWSIAERDARGGDRLELLLTRLVDMPARGYYAADLHMHSTFSDGKQPPEQVALDCQAEGLHIAALTDHENVAQQEPWLATATPAFLPLRGQEVTTRLGHILSIGCSQVVSNVVTGPESFADIFSRIHAQGGLAIVAHPCAPTMNYQAPDNHDYDAYEILNGSIPPYGGIFDMVQARKAWHAMLSQGLRIAAVGDSDNHDNLNALGRDLLQHPEKALQLDKRVGMLMKLVDVEKVVVPWGWKGLHPGFYRTYLQLPERTPPAVQAAVKAGRGFVTNGPLLVATLDDQPPGSEIAANGRQNLPFKAELFANRPLERLVFVINGQEAITLQSNAARVEVTLPLKPGDWVTAELYGQWPEFATTNAWYVR
jgi:predicted metal-dependent phosphoesterase TrpH